VAEFKHRKKRAKVRRAGAHIAIAVKMFAVQINDHALCAAFAKDPQGGLNGAGERRDDHKVKVGCAARFGAQTLGLCKARFGQRCIVHHRIGLARLQQGVVQR